MRCNDILTHQPTSPPKRQRKPHLVLHHRLPVDPQEVMVMLKVFEVPTPHRVLKERRPLISRNQRLMMSRNPELPPPPNKLVAIRDQPACLALYRTKPDRALHQLNARSQQKAALNRRIHPNTVFHTKHRSSLKTRYTATLALIPLRSSVSASTTSISAAWCNVSSSTARSASA